LGFGAPDSAIERQPAGQVVVEITGLHIYDPTTGQIRNSSTDDIACWFIDTNYNGESFFVRHAYFTGGDEPYQRLQRALRVDGGEPTRDRAYTLMAELLLMQYTCHWFCRSRTVATARLVALHQTTPAQVLAAVTPATREDYAALTGLRLS
jgi:hypothetical protein